VRSWNHINARNIGLQASRLMRSVVRSDYSSLKFSRFTFVAGERELESSLHRPNTGGGGGGGGVEGVIPGNIRSCSTHNNAWRNY